MRSALTNLLPSLHPSFRPDLRPGLRPGLRVRNHHPSPHLGLAYERLGPPKQDTPAFDEWLTALEHTGIDGDYAGFYRCWRESLAATGDHTFVVEARSRLLIGVGNPSASEAGLTVHHSWGVPMLPGSALKGVCAHYVAGFVGEGDDDPWRPVARDDRRILRGPGRHARWLFGAPDADADRSDDPHAGATAGHLHFHDALYIPGSCADDRPFARDVLTVHQKPYYDSSGREAASDHHDPIPVAFLTVRPGTRFLVALACPPSLALELEQLLLDALDHTGIGAKTSLGYGHLTAARPALDQATPATPPQPHQSPQTTPRAPSQVKAQLEQFKASFDHLPGTLKDKIPAFIATHGPTLRAAPHDVRLQFANFLSKKKLKNPALRTIRDQFVATLKTKD